MHNLKVISSLYNYFYDIIVIASKGKEVKLMSTNKKRRKQNRQMDLYKIFELTLKLLEIIFAFYYNTNL